MGPEAANVLPGLKRIAEASRHMTASRRLLLLAEERPRGRPRTLLLPIQIDDPHAEVLLAEVKRRLGTRWLGEDWELRALRRELGAGYPLWYWPVGIVFVLFVAAVTILAIVRQIAGKSKIVVMNADGSRQRSLTRGRADDGAPAWSPDGRLIAFGRLTGANEDIYVMRADGGGVRRLTRSKAKESLPDWQG